MRCGIYIGLIVCMTQFYNIFGIHVGLIHYMSSRVLFALQMKTATRGFCVGKFSDIEFSRKGLWKEYFALDN